MRCHSLVFLVDDAWGGDVGEMKGLCLSFVS